MSPGSPYFPRRRRSLPPSAEPRIRGRHHRPRKRSKREKWRARHWRNGRPSCRPYPFPTASTLVVLRLLGRGRVVGGEVHAARLPSIRPIRLAEQPLAPAARRRLRNPPLRQLGSRLSRALDLRSLSSSPPLLL